MILDSGLIPIEKGYDKAMTEPQSENRLTILYEDPWFVAVDKPAGMLVHPGKEPEAPDQIAMKVVRDQIGKRVGTLHRLDRPTSGVLLFALDPAIEKELRRQFTEQLVEKKYTAVVIGETGEKWTDDTPLQKEDGEPFRDAKTSFLQTGSISIGDQKFTVLAARPATGRYHQIRKHLAGAGHPIVGDYLYGEVARMETIAQQIGQTRLMLHASELRFLHPVENTEIMITSSLPERFAPFRPAFT